MDHNSRRIPNKLYYCLIFFSFLFIYFVSLKWVFPQYFSPFIPHHSDILDYPYDYQVMGLGARPVGIILTGFFGLFWGHAGIVISACLCTCISMLLIISIHQKETGIRPWAPAVVTYGILVFTASTFYINYSFDIYGTYALTLGLVAIRVSCNWKKKETLSPGLLVLIFLFQTAGFCSKETYIVCFCGYYFFLFILQVDSRKKNMILLVITILAACIALLYGKIIQSPFTSGVSVTEDSPYYFSVSPLSLIKTFGFYARGLLNLPELAFFATLLIYLILSKNKTIWMATVFCVCGVFAFFPYATLPNKVVPHYCFCAIPIVYGLILLIDGNHLSGKKNRLLLIGGLALFCIAAVLGNFSTKSAYGYPAMRGWIVCEKNMSLTLRSTEEINNRTKDGDEILVLGLGKTMETAYRSLVAINHFFPKDIHFSVICDYPEYCGEFSEKVTYVSQPKSVDNYDLFVYYHGDSYQITDNVDTITEIAIGAPEIVSIYPGTEITTEILKPDGSLDIGIVCKKQTDDLVILVNGQPSTTIFGDGFISTTLSSETIASGKVIIQLKGNTFGQISEPVYFSFLDEGLLRGN